MENLSSADMGLQNIRNEITQGRELAEQLQIHINAPDSSQEICLLLINKLIDSYDKALTMVDPDGHLAVAATEAPESPPCLCPSPTSLPGCDMESSKDHPNRNNGSKNKKDMPRWTKYVQVCPVPGAPEGPLVEDGYSWRKYGQKDILGAKYRRGYYRCAHRHSQGCQATKKVQRLDDDPTTVEITYRGNHTCDLSIICSKLPSTTTRDHQRQNSSSNNGADRELLALQQQQQEASAISSNLLTGLNVITDNLDTQQYQTPLYSFNFPTPSSLNHEIYTLSPCLIDHHNFFANFSPPGLPANSTSPQGSSYLLASPTHIDSFQGSINVSTSGAELSQMAPATTSSAAISPTMDMDFPLSTWGHGSNFGL